MPRNISFDELVVKVSAAHVVVDAAVKPALEVAAQLVKEEAEKKFGHYNSATGPFKGWAALAPDYLSRKIAAGGSESPLVGVPSLNRVYPTPLKDTIDYTIRDLTAHIGTNDPLGEWHEFGAVRRVNTLPQRPFLRPALWQNKEKIAADIGEAIGTALVGYFK